MVYQYPSLAMIVGQAGVFVHNFGAMKLNLAEALVALEPMPVVAITSRLLPAAWAGVVTVQVVVPAQVTPVAAVPPKEAICEG